MAALLMHAVVYVVVNAMLVVLWVILSGSVDDLRAYVDSPASALTPTFWPVFPILVWGAALLIHAAAATVSLLPGSRRRRAARRRERERQRRRRAYLKEREKRRRERAARKEAAERARLAEAEARAEEARLAAELHNRGPKRQWVVVMFTDISRSTPWIEALGDEAWAAVLADHRAAVRRAIGGHDGSEVGTQGDGFLVQFDDPNAAVRCAIALQRDLEETRSRGELVPEIRVGVHAGEAIKDEEDLVGRVVHLAARVCDIAEPGEILVTEPVADHLEPSIALVDRGLRSLRGLTQPRHLLAVSWLGVEDADVIVLDSTDSGWDDQPRT